MQKIAQGLLITALLTPSLTFAAKHNNDIDRGQINTGRIEYWLNRRGEIGASDTLQDKQQKVADYIKRFSMNNNRNLRQVDNYQRKSFQDLKVFNRQQVNGINKASDIKTTAVNVLAILIDFPDLPYNENKLTSNDTDLFYLHYSPSHYTNLLFSDSGFAGPDAQNFMSVKQYYDRESGNTFDFSGSVFGWYRAQNPARFYGGNSDGGNDQNAEKLVVEAINAAISSDSVDLTKFDVKDPQDLDKDNNFDEPDGFIDHVLIVHSSIGEEAGGGYLGTDAIWSHRFSVPTADSSIEGSGVKVRNYTIVPIDSGAGVVAHEFGHDLGLADEYDLNSTLIGSPVGYWSIMSSGSWLGQVRGTEPTVFSPIGREKLQASFGGNWNTQQVIKADELSNSPLDVAMTQASNHNETPNQIKVELPPLKKFFGAPKQGQYQLLATHKHDSHYRFSTTIAVPDSANVKLTLWAKWEIEEGYDYAQISIDGVPLVNDYTTNSSLNIDNVENFITGKLSGTPWTKLSFDINKYRGNKSVTLTIDYVTDPAAAGGFGIAVHDIGLEFDSTTQSLVDFEQSVPIVNGDGKLSFCRITAYRDAEPDYYYMQLRSNSLLDKGLKSVDYEPGVLLWYRNDAFTDNNSSEHPGAGFIAVIDADQNRLKFADEKTQIRLGNTEAQIRDAAFSLYPQSNAIGDNHLSAISSFDDANDYSSPQQPQNGTKLPLWGIKFLVTQHAIDSNTATIALSRDPIKLASEIEAERNGLTVSFKSNSTSSYTIAEFLWNLGDEVTSTLPNPVHTFIENGSYNVTLTVTDSSGATTTTASSITVGPQLNVTTSHELDIFDASFNANVSGGVAPYSFNWNLGDGNQSTLQSVNYRYSKVGIYTVMLTTTDAIEQTQTSEIKITVESGLTIDFSNTAANQVVTFTGTITNPSGQSTILWDFGDGQTSNACARIPDT